MPKGVANPLNFYFLNYSGMFQQNFDTDKNKHQAAGHVSSLAGHSSQLKASQTAKGCDSKGHHANQYGSGPDIGIQKGQADTNCQSINIASTAISFTL